MPNNNFKIFDENKTNIMSDGDYSSESQRLNGVQTGVASSQLNNKFSYQVSLVACAIAQLMNLNGYDASDSDSFADFAQNMSDSIVQKVVDKASNTEADGGTDNAKWITARLVKRMIEKFAPSAILNIKAPENYTVKLKHKTNGVVDLELSKIADSSNNAEFHVSWLGTYCIEVLRSGVSIATSDDFILDKIEIRNIEYYLDLDDVSWDNIENLSNDHVVDVLFELGSKKDFVADGNNYEAVLIACDHDRLTSDNSLVGTTFMLSWCWDSLSKIGNDSLTAIDYGASIVDHAIRDSYGSIYTKLPNSLVSKVKEVKKPCYSSGTPLIENYNRYFWLFSAEEAFTPYTYSQISSKLYGNSGDEGTHYSFIEENSQLIKKQGENGSPVSWWIRSMYYDSDSGTNKGFWRVSVSGSYDSIVSSNKNDNGSPSGVCFGFCV